jgi:hypothetical protein
MQLRRKNGPQAGKFLANELTMTGSPRNQVAWVKDSERYGKIDSGQVNNLTGLRSGNNSLEVCVLAAVAGSFLTFSRAFDATLLLLLLFLSAGTFSLAFLH